MNPTIAIVVLKALYKFVRPAIATSVKDSKTQVDDFILSVFDKILK